VLVDGGGSAWRRRRPIASGLNLNVEPNVMLINRAPGIMQHAIQPNENLILSANSGDRRQNCEAAHACFGSRCFI
jgi:hypothetical protein